jgi:hypothetical protein
LELPDYCSILAEQLIKRVYNKWTYEWVITIFSKKKTFLNCKLIVEESCGCLEFMKLFLFARIGLRIKIDEIEIKDRLPWQIWVGIRHSQTRFFTMIDISILIMSLKKKCDISNSESMVCEKMLFTSASSTYNFS